MASRAAYPVASTRPGAGFRGRRVERAPREQAHGLSQQRVLERAQRRQNLVWIACPGQLDGALEDHGAGVDAGVDEVHRHAKHPHPVCERLLDRVQTGKRGQQRGMDVDHGPREPRQEPLRQQRHVTGEHDQAHTARLEPVREGFVAGRAIGVIGAREHLRGDTARGGPLQRRGPGERRRDRHDPGLVSVDGVEQRLQVRARAGHEHGDRQLLLGRRLVGHGADDSCDSNHRERSGSSFNI